MAAFTRGLNDEGFADGHNLTIEYRYAEDRFDRLPALAADLVAEQVRVIAAVGGAPSILAAKAATHSIPIVFANGTDPVKLGIVESLNRPGGNITGATFIAADLGTKRLELIRELLPDAAKVALLCNPKNPNTKHDVSSVQEAADEMHFRIDTLNVSSEHDINAAFAGLVTHKPDALLVLAESLFSNRRDQLIAHSTQQKIPTVYYSRDFVVSGGLIGYGGSIPDAFRHAGGYLGKILKGASPADLPILLPTKYNLVINLRTAKTMGLNILPSLVARADEVIE
jgi:putative ABC transport system substrate-binding protein